MRSLRHCARRMPPLAASAPSRRGVECMLEMANDDRTYLFWVSMLMCCSPGAPRLCSGEVVPHHATHLRGLGYRSDDNCAIALCQSCHRNFHSASGPFRGWTMEKRREWQADRIAQTRADVNRMLASFDVMCF